MAQIDFPNDFLSQTTLLNDVITKNSSPGFKSPLNAWLKKKEMDLTAYATAGGKAQACDKQRLSYESVSQQNTQDRDKLFGDVFQFVMKGAQSLKKWYKPTYALLKDWGIPITASGRIDYPSSFEERSAIATTFFEKYDSDTEEENPLAAFVSENEIDVPSLEKDLQDAIKMNASAKTNAKLAENATAQRNEYWDDVAAALWEVGDYLKSIYVKNPRMLGEWGYTIDESEGKVKLKRSKLRIGETKVLTGVKIGSILTVTGKGGIILYRGGKATGAAYPLQAGEKMGMVKGFSTVTIMNPSTLETTEISLELPE